MKNKRWERLKVGNSAWLTLTALWLLSAASLVAGSGPVAHWTMDKIEEGRILLDKEGGHDAILAEIEDFTPGNVTGVVGDALNLVTSQQGYAAVKGGEEMRFPDGLTVCAWIKPDDRNQLGDIITCRYDIPDANAGWRLRYGFSQVFFQVVDANGKTVQLESSQDSVQAKNWVHVAAVVGASEVKLFLNGSEVAKAPFDGPMAEPTPPVTPLIIGNHATIASYRHDKCPAFGGDLDEIKIFDRPLSDEEVVKESNP